jgi:hypothetical protein
VAIDVLPALPKAWPTGKVTGLRARDSFVIDLEWSEGTLVRVTLRSQLGRPFQLRYAGQALNIVSPAYISAALSIWSVEARHASVAGLLLAPTPANISPNGAFDKPKTAAQVLKAVEATGFLK